MNADVKIRIVTCCRISKILLLPLCVKVLGKIQFRKDFFVHDRERAT